MTVRYTIAANGACPATFEDVTFTVNAEPVATTGGDATVCITAGSYVLTGNTPSAGTGTWSILGGSVNMSLSQFSSVNDPSATFTPITTGIYFLRWTVSNPPCTDKFSNMTLTFTQISAPRLRPRPRQPRYVSAALRHLV
ncbi:MAG: hypothetical protein H6574_23025 [Lewinellaceae bacterium]|nr:hypothetical protein [Lewinellaceae bacterium]